MIVKYCRTLFIKDCECTFHTTMIRVKVVLPEHRHSLGAAERG